MWWVKSRPSQMCLAMIHYHNCFINRHSYSYSTCVLSFRAFSAGVILKSACHVVNEWHENNGSTHKLWQPFWEVCGFLQWIKHMNHWQTEWNVCASSEKKPVSTKLDLNFHECDPLDATGNLCRPSLHHHFFCICHSSASFFSFFPCFGGSFFYWLSHAFQFFNSVTLATLASNIETTIHLLFLSYKE